MAARLHQHRTDFHDSARRVLGRLEIAHASAAAGQPAGWRRPTRSRRTGARRSSPGLPHSSSASVSPIPKLRRRARGSGMRKTIRRFNPSAARPAGASRGRVGFPACGTRGITTCTLRSTGGAGAELTSTFGGKKTTSAAFPTAGRHTSTPKPGKAGSERLKDDGRHLVSVRQWRP
jgi:hypothetical protein